MRSILTTFLRSLLSTNAVKLSATAGLLACLVSCGTMIRPMSPETLKVRGLKAGEGYIVGTLSAQGVSRDGKKLPALNNVHLHISGTGATSSIVPLFSPETSSGDNVPAILDYKARMRDVIAIPVPAGTYNVTGWSMVLQSLTATMTFGNAKPIEIPFEVRAGEATYVGRVNSLTILGKNLLGMYVPGEVMVVVTDEFAADSARIAKEYTAIPRDRIRRSNVAQGYRQEMKRIAETPPTWMDRLW